MVLRPTYDVVAALLFDDKGRILACKRPTQDAWAGWWEFPGGKVDEGESYSQALSREIEEEMGVSIEPGDLVESISFDYEDRTVRLQIWNCGIINPDSITLRSTTILDGCQGKSYLMLSGYLQIYQSSLGGWKKESQTNHHSL